MKPVYGRNKKYNDTGPPRGFSPSPRPAPWIFTFAPPRPAPRNKRPPRTSLIPRHLCYWWSSLCPVEGVILSVSWRCLLSSLDLTRPCEWLSSLLRPVSPRPQLVISGAAQYCLSVQRLNTPEWTHNPQGSLYPTTPHHPNYSCINCLVTTTVLNHNTEAIKPVTNTGAQRCAGYQLAYCHCSSHPRLNQAAPLIRRCSWCPRNSLLLFKTRLFLNLFQAIQGDRWI